MSRYYYGIDPGITNGAWAVITDDDTIQPHWEPFVDCTVASMGQQLQEWSGLVRGALERVDVMPRQKGRDKLVYHNGQLEGICYMLGVPFQVSRARAWRSELGLPPVSDAKKRKHANKEAAERLFPGCKVTTTNCDALLLAWVARKQNQ